MTTSIAAPARSDVAPDALTTSAARSTIARAGLLTGVTDGTFSSVLNVAFYGASVARLFQGVAATLLGRSAIDGGPVPTAIGVLMHFGVAFGWSAVFVLLAQRWGTVRRALRSPGGVATVAAIYGPCVWIVMSMLVIPVLLHRPPAINARWWVQLVGHVPFVGLPIVWMTHRSLRSRSRSGYSEIPESDRR